MNFKTIIKSVQIVILSLMVLNPTLVIAQTKSSSTEVPTYRGVQGSIKQYLCTPSASADGHDLERCINKLYRFGISFGAIALVFFIVLAGYMYISGGESGKTKAKGMIQNALVGMGLLLGSYVLLSFINPALVVLKPIQPPIFIASDFPSCEDVGFGDQCMLPDGSHAISNGTGGGTKINPCKSALVKVKSKGINVYFGKDPVICPGLLDKMAQFDQAMKSARLTWGVTATVEGDHKDACHKSGTSETGTCFDMDVPTASANPGQWEQTCKLLKQVGLNLIVNETKVDTDIAPSCGKKLRYETSKGDSLHINYADG